MKTIQRPISSMLQQYTLQFDFFTPGSAAPQTTDDTASSSWTESIIPTQTPLLRLPDSAVTTPTPSSPSSSGKRRLYIHARVLDYTLLRSKRRSIGFLINDDGLRVTAPRRITIAEIEQAILNKQRWIFTKLQERQERSLQRSLPQRQWCDGATLSYLGTTITLRIRTMQTARMTYDAVSCELIADLLPGTTEQQLKENVQVWLQTQAKQLFIARLPLYAAKLGVSYRAFSLSSARTQWGSCTTDGKIRLNWRLIHFALPLIDYVIAHELSHLREMNHSPRFWATVQSIFPEFAAAKKALRTQAQEILLIY